MVAPVHANSSFHLAKSSHLDFPFSFFKIFIS